jgi:hypothetical protein
LERLGTEVSRLLYKYYGWVIPLPLLHPENHISWIPEEDRKSFKAVLGLNQPLWIALSSILHWQRQHHHTSDYWQVKITQDLLATCHIYCMTTGCA